MDVNKRSPFQTLEDELVLKLRKTLEFNCARPKCKRLVRIEPERDRSICSGCGSIYRVTFRVDLSISGPSKARATLARQDETGGG